MAEPSALARLSFVFDARDSGIMALAQNLAKDFISQNRLADFHLLAVGFKQDLKVNLATNFTR